MCCILYVYEYVYVCILFSGSSALHIQEPVSTFTKKTNKKKTLVLKELECAMRYWEVVSL